MVGAQTIFYRDRVGVTRGAARARVGQLSREAISVCGFASARDAIAAASVGFHALRQYLAERTGRPLPSAPADAAAVTVRESPDVEAAPFCFELRFPMRLTATTAIRAANAIEDALDRWRTHRLERPDEIGEGVGRPRRDDVDEDSIQGFPASLSAR